MKKLLCLAFGIFSLILVSCSNKKPARLVLWTNRVEFVSCAELFNSVQDEVKVIVLYKDAPETLLPVADGETPPDLIAGTFLQSGISGKHYAKLDSLFGKKRLSRDDFYPALLDSGRWNEKQYLLPVSFNLPAMVFHSKNYDYVQDKFLSFDAIKQSSRGFNKKNSGGIYTAMGFAPHWDTDFLYLVFKTLGITYTTEKEKLVYSEYAFNSALEKIKEWSTEINDSVQHEQDFAFKYLYMPFYKQVQNGNCLFSYAPSNKIMTLAEDELENIDFRWICSDKKIFIEDDAVMMGIYSGSRKKAAAKKFMLWFFNENSQKDMLERKFAMKLKSSTFGIAGGFSSLRSVNEKVFPTCYRALLSNIPGGEFLKAPQIFPPDWAGIKREVVLPFIVAGTEDSGAKVKSLEERYAEYRTIKDSKNR